MRRAARVDGNQSTLVSLLVKLGASVVSLSSVGKGVPDLLVGYKGRNLLLEVKDPTVPTRDQELTKDQIRFVSTWKGSVRVVKTEDDVLRALGFGLYQGKGEEGL